MRRRYPRGVLLRDHVVRRIPTPAELRQRRPMVVTDRDRRILEAIADFGFLPTDLIVRAFFPAKEAALVPTSAAYARIRLLWLWGFLDRVELPVARIVGGRRPFLYALGARGVRWVNDRRGPDEPAVQRRRPDRLDDRFLDHDLTVARFWVHVLEELRGSYAVLERWLAETTIRSWWSVPSHDGGRPWPSGIPDGIAEIRYPDETIQCMVVEVDMDTVPLRRFARKLQGFEDARTHGQLQDRLGYADFEVVVLAPTRARIAHLATAARQVVSPERWASYRFAPVAVLDQVLPRTACWVDLADQTSPLLDADAFADRVDRRPTGGDAGVHE
jgi:hypothetical protein